MDTVNTQLNIHSGLMFNGKLSDRKQSELKTLKLMFLCLQYIQRNFQNLKKTYFVTRKS